MGELAGGGFVAVAVGVSERCQVNGDRRNLTGKGWQAINDM